MNWYRNIEIFYDYGYYTEDQVFRFVELGKITLEEANTIIGNGEE